MSEEGGEECNSEDSDSNVVATIGVDDAQSTHLLVPPKVRSSEKEITRGSHSSCNGDVLLLSIITLILLQ